MPIFFSDNEITYDGNAPISKPLKPVRFSTRIDFEDDVTECASSVHEIVDGACWYLMDVPVLVVVLLLLRLFYVLNVISK